MFSVAGALHRPVAVQVDRIAPPPDQAQLERGVVVPAEHVRGVADADTDPGNAGLEVAKWTDLGEIEVDGSPDVAVAPALEVGVLLDAAEVEPQVDQRI